MIDVKELAKELTDINTPTFEESELNKILKEAKLDKDKHYEKPIPVISMIANNGSNRDVLTIGNISGTIGGAKSKKTFFASMLISSLLGNDSHAVIGNNQNLNTIFFDTEQAHYHVQKLNRRVKSITGNNNKLEIFALRPYLPEQRLAVIEHYLKLKNGSYSFVIIDGVVDLLYDFNSQEESKKVITKLMEWSQNYNCHINSVLHTNKDFGNARGHLGSELMNKSETVFRIHKESDTTSKVICEVSRNMGFDEWEFSIDDKGLPIRTSMPTGWYDNSPDKLPEIIDNSAGLNNDQPPF